MKKKKEFYRTDIFGEFAVWVWGKCIPTEVYKCQIFMRKSPLGRYIRKLEKENKDLKDEIDDLELHARG